MAVATSCDKHEGQSVPKHNMIGFVSADADSRSVIDGNDEATNHTIARDAAENSTGFGVVGYRNRSGWAKTFNNKLVTPVVPITSPAEWEYTDVQYWEFCPYRFFAYYPYKADAELDLAKCLEANMSDVAFAVKNYIVPNTWDTSYEADQQDFMLASPVPVTTAENGQVVNFNFHHALCRVGFKVLKAGDNDLSIDNLELQRISSKGKATVSSTGSISWTDRSATLNYSYNSGLGTNRTVPKTDIPYMLLMPQSISDNTRVVLTVRDGGGATWTLSGLIKGASGVNTWTAGKTYLYTLTINSDPVLMDMALTVSDWVDVKINVTM